MKKPALHGTPVSSHRYRAQKTNLLKDETISDLMFQDATGQPGSAIDTGSRAKSNRIPSSLGTVARSEMSFSAIKGETGNQTHNHGETADINNDLTALSDLDYDDLQPSKSN